MENWKQVKQRVVKGWEFDKPLEQEDLVGQERIVLDLSQLDNAAQLEAHVALRCYSPSLTIDEAGTRQYEHPLGSGNPQPFHPRKPVRRWRCRTKGRDKAQLRPCTPSLPVRSLLEAYHQLIYESDACPRHYADAARPGTKRQMQSGCGFQHRR